jgi:hypothetical protein
MRQTIGYRRGSVRGGPPSTLIPFGSYSDDPAAWRQGIEFFKSGLEILAGMFVLLLVLVCWAAWKLRAHD